MESKELVDLTLAQQKQFDLVSFRVSWSQAVLFGCYEVRFLLNSFCEAQARVRQGSARDGPKGERPQSLKYCPELTLKLVATTHHHPKFNFT